ncbi:MAG: hypothetical protein GEV07_12675 [Streptosporangiales bacterium]|nr:hypothetical protein [Streptosporangiales bacterium]
MVGRQRIGGASMVIVPVGLDMGPVYVQQDTADPTLLYYQVHLGGSPEELDVAEYTVWACAFADPDAHLDLKVDRARLEEAVHQHPAQVADPAAVIGRLVERGLLLEFEPGAGDRLAAVFGTHRLFPRALGLGSTAQLPYMYGIGYGSSRFAEVPSNVYHVWSFGIALPSLWHACRQFAETVDLDLPPYDEPLNLTAGEVADQVAENLPLLVSTRAAFLDVVNYDPPVPPPEPVPLPRRAPDGRPPVLVPVGMSLGWDYWYDDPEQRDEQYYQAHLAYEYADLSRAEFTAWLAAFNDLGRHARHEVTRETLVRDLAVQGMTDAAYVVTRLLDRGLLVEFEPSEGPVEPLLSAVRLYPLGDGLGNTQEQPELFRLGVEDEPLVEVDAITYTVWSYALTTPTAWDACATLAGSLQDAAAQEEEPEAVTAENVARAVAGALPALISAGCAYIDPVSQP